MTKSLLKNCNWWSK